MDRAVSGERVFVTDARPLRLVDLDGLAGAGPVWGMASEDLNATVLCWAAGEGVSDHVNAERDVLLVVTAGSGVVAVDGRRYEVRRHSAMLVPKGCWRSIEAGAEGLRYLSVHLRRGGLQIEPAAADNRAAKNAVR